MHIKIVKHANILKYVLAEKLISWIMEAAQRKNVDDINRDEIFELFKEIVMGNERLRGNL